MVCPINRNISLVTFVFTLWAVALLTSLNGPKSVFASKESEIVESWAQMFGDELWDLAQKMTKSNEIKLKYKAYNAAVAHKQDETLIQDVVENVKRMLDRKIDAVRCILTVAEEVAESFQFNETESRNFTYYSSKYSAANNVTIQQRMGDATPEIVQANKDMYRAMILDQDTHFYNISVNTSHSSVHVPINVYDKSPRVLEALQWSEALDEVFVQNYNSDPALSWQYFGSDTGILRHYPAKVWENKDIDNDIDVYDCRKRSWYIETATCSKDIVIILDNSGSMLGFRNFIAQLTVKSILDTFSNNDFINIYYYSENVSALVPCFNDTLVQATPENIKVFNEHVKHLKPEGYANVSKAYVQGFELLKKYREVRKCNESATGCNQAIMLITDGVPGNTTDIFDKYNWLETANGTKVPVRIFTYLLGKEVTKVREIQWMACLNRGYYSHVQTLDEVQGEVLKYVTVIATPLVLQGVEHPPTWTHAFRDIAAEVNLLSNEEPEKQPPRLMIAVGVPSFIRKVDKNNVTIPSLLGVAATDVPVEDINKLSLPYKLGVNGYSFIVSNNGYVLLHPDLRPMENGLLKDNYNSIDFTEVEQFHESKGPRDPGEQLLKLREALVTHEWGKMLNVTVRFHYDKMRRVSLESYDYYYAPLSGTPFSLGLAIPNGYGNTWIKVNDEVKRNLHMGINISDFFVGENWKVHPEWVYCKYHYLEGHEYKNPEEELRHFLKKLAEPNWKWSEQYERDDSEEEKNDHNCAGKSLSDDSYYCNRELVQLLIFDAKVTNASYRSWEFENQQERDLIERYNATLRFVATMSGLTRWQFIFGEVEVETDREFGDYHTNAIDETWYKNAILQHKIDPQSFVYIAPHADDPVEDEDLKVTASHAIFPRDGGAEAPGCVVGFQFSQSMMRERFMEITSKANCDGCLRTCSDDLQDCYVIDNNGYIIISERENDTGKFFGEVEGSVMQALVEMEIYKVITVYDLQALCARRELVENDGNLLSALQPFKILSMAVKWSFTQLFIYYSRISYWTFGISATSIDGIHHVYEQDDDDDNDHDDEEEEETPESEENYADNPNRPNKNDKIDDSFKKVIMDEEDEYFNRIIEPTYETHYEPCDKKSNLYLLHQERFLKGKPPPSKGQSVHSRPFYFKRIPHSNLLMVIINTAFQTRNFILTAAPEKIEYQEEFPCYKLKLNDLPRRRLEECFTEHPDEANVTYCGKGFIPSLNYMTSIMSLLTFILFKFITQNY